MQTLFEYSYTILVFSLFSKVDINNVGIFVNRIPYFIANNQKVASSDIDSLTGIFRMPFSLVWTLMMDRYRERMRT